MQFDLTHDDPLTKRDESFKEWLHYNFPYVKKGCDEWCNPSIYGRFFGWSWAFFWRNRETRNEWFLSGHLSGKSVFVSPDYSVWAWLDTKDFDYVWDDNYVEHFPSLTTAEILKYNPTFSIFDNEDEEKDEYYKLQVADESAVC